MSLNKDILIIYGIYLNITAIINVNAGNMLLMAHEKVGEVSFNPA